MKKLAAVILVLSTLFTLGCKKSNVCQFADSKKIAPESEINNLSDSLEKYGIRNAMLHPSGFYYTIENPGSGAFVSNLCSTVKAHYWGGFFDGRSFDANTDNFVLGQTIVGWQKGIPLVNEGGKITIYIPPSLAYADEVKRGPGGVVLIPAYSYLVFKVEVIKIQ